MDVILYRHEVHPQNMLLDLGKTLDEAGFEGGKAKPNVPLFVLRNLPGEGFCVHVEAKKGARGKEERWGGRMAEGARRETEASRG
jgi:hypothetical protein